MADIHIIAPFIDANGGDWHAIDLYLYLRSSHNVSLWSSQTPNPALRQLYPIQQIRPYSGVMPESGILIIWGALTEIGHWYDHINFERVIVIHNLFAPDALFRCLHRLRAGRCMRIEIRYVSEMLKKTLELPGDVLYLPPHPERFMPIRPIRNSGHEGFVVGRISRDVIGKHHASDPALYRQLATKGIRVRIIGGTCLAPWLKKNEYLDYQPPIPQAHVPEMLGSFDCFFYRTSLGVKEAFGLVVMEAMLCGLPVVCHRQGGYAELIEHGKNGFLFSDNEEAVDIIERIRNDETLRSRVSGNAAEIRNRLKSHCYKVLGL
jgi:hypothetical protein